MAAMAVDVAQYMIDDRRRAAALPQSHKTCQRTAQPALCLSARAAAAVPRHENDRVHYLNHLAVDVAQQKIDDPRRAAALPLSRNVCQRAAQPSLPLDSPSCRRPCGAASKRRRAWPRPPLHSRHRAQKRDDRKPPAALPLSREVRWRVVPPLLCPFSSPSRRLARRREERNSAMDRDALAVVSSSSAAEDRREKSCSRSTSESSRLAARS